MIKFVDKKSYISTFSPASFFRSFLLLMVLFVTVNPIVTQAHTYSASYTNIQIMDTETNFLFSIDTLSIIEQLPDIDKNGNNEVDQSEIEEEQHELEEFVHHHLTFDVNNRQQEPTLESIELETKEAGKFLTYTMKFPAYAPGDTLSFNDGLYVSDPNTNYVNLLSFEFAESSGQAVLRGKERTWTVLLTEAQEEQMEQGQEQQNTAAETPNSIEKTTPSKVETSSSWFSFFKLGMLHILTGYDHLLFLFALLLRKQTFKQYAAIITSFTIAHSITISLAVLGVITLPSRFVEAVIAFSIVYVALENIFRKDIRNRWGLTFLFGLIHGLGFASILKEMNIPKSNLAVALFNFNIGIEVIQLGLVCILLPLLTYMFKLKSSKKIITIGSSLVAILGAFWLLERVFF